MFALVTCQPQAQGESQPEYASRVLRFALRYGAEYLTREQLAHADHRAQLEICSLPANTPAEPMDADQGRRYALLLRARRAIQEDQQRRAASALQDARTLAAWAVELDPEAEPLDAAQLAQADPYAQESDQERGIRLLRAALLLIMAPPDQGNGGGRGSRLQPPPRFDPHGPNGAQAMTEAQAIAASARAAIGAPLAVDTPNGLRRF